MLDLYISVRSERELCFCNDTATAVIYTYLHTLSLHDARPIAGWARRVSSRQRVSGAGEVPMPQPARRCRFPVGTGCEPQAGPKIPRFLIWILRIDVTLMMDKAWHYRPYLRYRRSEGRRVGTECFSTCRSR